MNNYVDGNFPLPVKIIGTGRYLPKQVILSKDLEEKIGIEKGWCESKQGIKERRWAENEETESFMGAKAVEEALKDACIQPNEIDLLINASQTFEVAVPDGGTLILKHLGLENKGIPTFTTTSACLSFLAGFDLAANLLVNEKYNNIVIVTSEITSTNLDYSNKEVITMVGDCAAAVVVTRPSDKTSLLHAIRMETYSKHSGVSSLSGGESYQSMFNKNIRPNDFNFSFNATNMQAVSMKYNKNFLKKLWPGLTPDTIQVVIPNQASRLAIDYLKLMFPSNKIINIISFLGNSGAVGYPMAIYQAIKDGDVKRGDKILLFGMGAGFSIYGMIITY